MAKYKIEIAKKEDLSEVLELIIGMHDEASTFYPPYNKNIMLRFMQPIINNGHCIILITDKKIVGAIGGVMAKWWFSENFYMADAFFFVDKKHRSYQNASALLKKLNKIANEKAIPLVVGTFDAKDIEKKDKFYEKLNFRTLGIRYGNGV